jgi:acyl-coenzyme A synthetase/AMP-(fatty) acid ligase
MKLSIVTLFLIVSATASAETFTCKIQGNRVLSLENTTLFYTQPMSYEACLAKAQQLFDETFISTSQRILVRGNAIQRKSWTSQYKRVKAVYKDQDGTTYSETLVRPYVEKGPVEIEIQPIKSGWRCWTRGECAPIED